MAKKTTEATEPQVAPQLEQQPEIHITAEMSQSIDVLIQAAEIAQKAGVYSFQDAKVICDAVTNLSPFRPRAIKQ